MTVAISQPVDADVAVIGSGFAGCLTALALRRTGRRVTLVERARHPRFAIGESSTPLANLLLGELAAQHDLPELLPFTKWGTWQETRPEVAVGLKRGFSFFFHEPGRAWADDAAHRRQLLVAASPHDAVADTHWYRSAFDHWLVQAAERSGVQLLTEKELNAVREEDDRIVLCGSHDGGSRHGERFQVAARFVIDASGPTGCLRRLLRLGEVPRRWLPATQGIYTHFRHVLPWKAVAETDARPPFPPDDAALHHVFPGGWIWVLRFNNGVVSAGAALTEALATDLGPTASRSGAWRSLLERLPTVAAQFRQARTVLPWFHAAPLCRRTEPIVGGRWALLPSAAGVIDPLLSTGFPLTLLGVQRLLACFDRQDASHVPDPAGLETYAADTRAELDITEQLMAALYANLADTVLFKRLTHLYFAAASYAETAHRLGTPELAPGFLLHRHPTFGPALRRCAALALAIPAGGSRAALRTEIGRAVAPFDLIGLSDESRQDWYPVKADDLRANAAKLRASPDAIETLIARSGMSLGPAAK